jgi:AraC family transcriptional regulator
MSTTVAHAPDDQSGSGPSGGAAAYRQALGAAGGRECGKQPLACEPASALVCAAIYASPSYSLSVPPLPVPRLAVNLTAAPVSGGFDGDRSRRFDARRHSLFLTPAGQPVTWRKESPSRHVVIYFHPDLFTGAGENAPTVPALFNATIPGVGLLIDQFADELQTPGLLNCEAADSLARLLLIRVARHLQRGASASHALTPAVLAGLRDYVIAHLRERILVADLARVAGLSPNYFAQLFTEKTGSSPHQFVLGLRVQRAAQILTRSESSLADVAFDCGFASQQHMCNALRRHLGETPSEIRALGKTGRATAGGGI